MSYTELTVVEGQSVTLQCTYSGSITTTCWGRGACSTFSCSDYIIRTDGYNVIFQKDPRYLLKGNIGHGDVSLTIVNVKLSDSGVYCCRVELAGWFNDLIVTYTLKVRPGEFVFLWSLPVGSRWWVFCLMLTFASFNRERGGSYILVFQGLGNFYVCRMNCSRPQARGSSPSANPLLKQCFGSASWGSSRCGSALTSPTSIREDVGSTPGLAVSSGVGRRYSLDLMLVWLWGRPVAAVLIRPLVWELPNAAGSSPKKQRKKSRKREKKC